VIIPIKDYEELLERAEDAEDVAWLKRARKRKLNYRSLEDYLAERNGKWLCVASSSSAPLRKISKTSRQNSKTG